MGRARHACVALAFALAITGFAACDEDVVLENAATEPAELARYLPEDTSLLSAVDVAEARKELGLPDDADALPLDNAALRDAESAQSKLFSLTTRAFPFVRDYYAVEFTAHGSSPLDGTLIKAAAANTGDLTIVSTEEPFAGVVDKLERTGYRKDDGLYVAGPDTPEAAVQVVADGAGGRVVFSRSERLARKTVRRIATDAEPGPAAEALHAVHGSVRLGTTYGKSRCVEAVAAAQSATGQGAIMALAVSGEKPEPDRFDPKAVKWLDVGTVSVLVDSLLVPFNIKRPTGPAPEPIDAIFGSGEREIEVRRPGRPLPNVRPPSPTDAYECPE